MSRALLSVPSQCVVLGLAFDFERIQSGNTLDAHRLLHLAKERGLQEQVEERLMHAYLCEGEAIGEPETLQRLATDAGLDFLRTM